MDTEEPIKRPHSENEDDDDNDVKRVRGVAGVDIGDKLVSMISKVDENVTGTIEETLIDLANVLSDHLEPYEGQIIEILAECAMYLPEKLTNFTTLIGLINAKSPEFGGNMISKLISLLNDTLVQEEYDLVLRLTTFLTDLGNAHVLTVQSIFEFLQEFVDLAEDENVRSDYFIYIVLHSLPWIGAELCEKKPTVLDSMLTKIQAYLDKRKKLHVKMLQVWSSSTIHPQLDSLDCLWTQIQKLKKDNWMEHHISRIYASSALAPTLKAAIAHNLPNVDPAVIITNKNMPLPRVVFRLFDTTDCPDENLTLASVTSIERFLVEEDLNWIIDNNYLDWRLCAKTLLNYHRRDFVPLNYAIVEVIFSQLFRLPRAPHLELFYGALLIELCHVRHDTLPQVLAQAAELLYQRADTMQPICLDRFVNWFSYHLSNFQYRWSWSDWIDCVDLDTLHPRLIFVREVVEKCLRFSYHKRVAEFLPKELHVIIPPEPVIIDIFSGVENQEAHALAKELQSLIEAKKPDQIFELLKKDSSDTESMEFNPDSVAIFTAVLLKLASKTFSHSFSALTKYHKVFRAVVEDNKDMQTIILGTLYDCWNRNKQMMTVLVDKMLKMQIVDPSIVQAWVFCDDMKREFKRSWVWDVLDTAINRLECHHARLTKDYQIQQKKISKLNSRKASGDNAQNVVVGEKHRSKIVAPDATPKDEQENMEVDAEVHDDLAKDNLLKEAERRSTELCAMLEDLEDNLRNILLNICHKFTLILTEHLLNCETDGTEVETDFFNYVSGRFRHIFLAHTDSMWKFVNDLDQELFSSPSIEPKILEIFNEFRALKL